MPLVLLELKFGHQFGHFQIELSLSALEGLDSFVWERPRNLHRFDGLTKRKEQLYKEVVVFGALLQIEVLSDLLHDKV